MSFIEYYPLGFNTLKQPRFSQNFPVLNSAGAKKLLKEKLRLPVEEIFLKIAQEQFQSPDLRSFSFVLNGALVSGSLQACFERGQPFLRIKLTNNGEVSLMLNKTKPQYGQQIQSVYSETNNINNRDALILLSKLGFEIGNVSYKPVDIANALARFPRAS